MRPSGAGSAARRCQAGRIEMIAALATLVFVLQASRTTVIQQTSTGACSPNFANITGHVTFICNGVNPDALVVLNAQLAATKQKEQQQLAVANAWAARY